MYNTILISLALTLSRSQAECDLEKGLEMRKWVLSGILASEETYLSHLEAILLVRPQPVLSLLLIYSIRAISGPLRAPHLGSCWLASPCGQLCGITKLNSLLNTPFELYFNVHEDRIKVTFSYLPP